MIDKDTPVVVVFVLILVTVYSVIIPPPVGAVKVIVTEDESITLAETFVGALGFVVTAVDAVDGKDIPPELVAVTVNV
jgi:hypothetical protein